jgi:hypothetical protein
MLTEDFLQSWGVVTLAMVGELRLCWNAYSSSSANDAVAASNG